MNLDRGGAEITRDGSCLSLRTSVCVCVSLKRIREKKNNAALPFGKPASQTLVFRNPRRWRCDLGEKRPAAARAGSKPAGHVAAALLTKPARYQLQPSTLLTEINLNYEQSQKGVYEEGRSVKATSYPPTLFRLIRGNTKTKQGSASAALSRLERPLIEFPRPQSFLVFFFSLQVLA